MPRANRAAGRAQYREQTASRIAGQAALEILRSRHEDEYQRVYEAQKAEALRQLAQREPSNLYERP